MARINPAAISVYRSYLFLFSSPCHFSELDDRKKAGVHEAATAIIQSPLPSPFPSNEQSLSLVSCRGVSRSFVDSTVARSSRETRQKKKKENHRQEGPLERFSHFFATGAFFPTVRSFYCHIDVSPRLFFATAELSVFPLSNVHSR